MAEAPQPPQHDAEAGIVDRIRALFAAIARYASARLRLISLEGRAATGQIAKSLALVGAAIVAGALAWLFFCLAVAFFLAQVIGGRDGWMWATLIVALVHGIVAWALVKAFKSRSHQPWFPLTAEEFRKDQEWLEAQKIEKK